VPDQRSDASSGVEFPSDAELQTWTTPAGTFAGSGGELVISTSTPHFAFGRLHDWVIVR
jgi:hypothetical protein